MKKTTLIIGITALLAHAIAQQNNSSPLMTYLASPHPVAVTLGSVFYAMVYAGDFDTVEGSQVEHCHHLEVEITEINSGQSLQWNHIGHNSTSHLMWENQKRARSEQNMAGTYYDWYKVTDKLGSPWNDASAMFAQRVDIGPMPGGGDPPPGGGG